MATTKKSTNTSRKTQPSGKGKSRKKNTSDDTMKFLLVLIIAGIAIALILFSRAKEDTPNNQLTGTPTPTMTIDQTDTPEPTPTVVTQPSQGLQTEITPEPTNPQEATKAPEPTSAEQPQVTETLIPTSTPEPTPTPTPALSAKEAEDVVSAKVDTSVYDVQLINENLVVGNGSYYQFGAIKDQKIIAPFMVVSKADGSLHFYDSTEETVYDFTKFPLQAEVTATPTPTPAPVSKLTAEEAYEVLCSYTKDALHIAKEVREYDAEYGSEFTLIDGVDCYRINLSEFSNGKVRNRGEFYVSVDGTKCYYIDSDTNEFIQAVK